jgi:hypothetical protein
MQRSSSSTTRSRYDTAFGSSKIRAAVSNVMPCFRRLVRFVLSSRARTMRIYRTVALHLSDGVETKRLRTPLEDRDPFPSRDVERQNALHELAPWIARCYHSAQKGVVE